MLILGILSTIGLSFIFAKLGGLSGITPYSHTESFKVRLYTELIINFKRFFVIVLVIIMIEMYYFYKRKKIKYLRAK